MTVAGKISDKRNTQNSRFIFVLPSHFDDRTNGHDRYWIGRLFASFERSVVNNLAKK